MAELFPDVVTLEEMIAEVEREVRLRKRVYPQFVRAGRLKLDRGERQIRVMEAVAETLRKLGGK